MYPEEHAFRTIQKDLKSGNLASVLLLCGKEGFLTAWAKNQIVNKYISPASKVLDLTIIDEDEIQDVDTATAIISACETLPLMSEKKVVVVNGTKLMTKSSKNATEDSDLGRLSAYLKNVPETTSLIFLEGTIDKRNKLPKEIASNGKVYDFGQLDRRELVSFADKRFKQGGVSLTKEVMDFLIDETGYFNNDSDYNLYTFDNDLIKMIASCDDGVLTKEIVRDTVEGDMETYIFTMLNSIGDGEKGKALRLLNNIVGNSYDVSPMIGQLVSHFEAMYQISQLRSSRIPDRIIAEELNIKPARIRALDRYVRRYSTENLKKILKEAYEIDAKIKKGILRPKMALEMFVAQL